MLMKVAIIMFQKWESHSYRILIRFYWDLISLAFLIVTMVVIPVGITFFNEDMTTVAGWMFFNLSLDSWFLIDIIINFRTGIVKVNANHYIEKTMSKLLLQSKTYKQAFQ